MENENKVIQFPGTNEEQVEETNAEQSVEATSETETADTNAEEALIKDPDNPLQDAKAVEELLKQAEFMVHIMEAQWNASVRELKIKDEHMKMLTKWNDDHKTNMPENLSDEERAEWDHWNGIDSITDEEIDRIFGADHPIHGVDHSQTLDRIKGVCKDFLGWITTLREYRNIHDAYLQLLELEEEKNIEVLRKKAEDETDPEKKKAFEDSIDTYYNRKYLEWLAKPLDEKGRNRILIALQDPKKIEYWVKRCRDKLDQLKISQKFIFEIASFEKRFLEEKYRKCDNILVLYFMNLCGYCKASYKDDDARIKTVCMVVALDAFIRNQWTEEKKERILNNIRAFEDQFIDYIKEPEDSGEISPPIKNESSNPAEEQLASESGPDAPIKVGNKVDPSANSNSEE